MKTAEDYAQSAHLSTSVDKWRCTKVVKEAIAEAEARAIAACIAHVESYKTCAESGMPAEVIIDQIAATFASADWAKIVSRYEVSDVSVQLVDEFRRDGKVK